MKRAVVVLLTVAIMSLALSSCKREVFYGEWQVKGVAAYNRIYGLEDEQIKALIGKTVTYSASRATFGDDVLENPHYVQSVESRTEFEQLNRLSFEQLGLKGNSVIRVDVFADKDGKALWRNVFADGFTVRDQNTLLIWYDGVCFELTRAR